MKEAKSPMTTKTMDHPQTIPAEEATLLRLAQQPEATVKLSKTQEAMARQIDEHATPHVR